MTATWQIIPGDCIASLRSLPDCSVQTCITSGRYKLRVLLLDRRSS